MFLFLRMLLASPFGRALQGIRSNEHRMRSLGFPVYRYKLASFALAGALAGLAGYLSAMQFGFVNPELLSWHQSGNVLLMLILGGLGSLYGAVVGAFAFVALQESLFVADHALAAPARRDDHRARDLPAGRARERRRTLQAHADRRATE